MVSWSYINSEPLEHTRKPFQKDVAAVSLCQMAKPATNACAHVRSTRSTNAARVIWSMLVLLNVRVTSGMACKCVTAEMCPDGSHVKSTLTYLHPADTLVLASYRLCLDLYTVRILSIMQTFPVGCTVFNGRYNMHAQVLII